MLAGCVVPRRQYVPDWIYPKRFLTVIFKTADGPAPQLPMSVCRFSSDGCVIWIIMGALAAA